MNTDMLKNRSLDLHSLKLPSLFTLLLLFLIGCSAFYSKSNYIEDFTSFVQETKDNCAKYTEEDWVNADEQYDKYTVELYEKFKLELTSEDKLTIGKLQGSYTVLKVKKGANELLEQGKDLLNQAEGIVDEVIDTTNK